MNLKKILCLIASIATLICTSLFTLAQDTVTITFEPNDGNEAYTIEEVKGNQLHELPTADMDGTREFLGWFTDEQFTQAYDISTPVMEDFTLYAGWKETILPFTDVSDTDAFVKDVKYVYLNKIMNGITETEFAPNDTLTRAMLVTILHRSENEPIVNYKMSFSDVEDDKYYTEAVRWAQSEGIVNGITKTQFAPNKNVTRAELACIIYRYADSKNLDLAKLSEDTNTLSYNDIMDVPSWASSEIHSCLATDILEGRDENIAPLLDATRAEAAHAIRIERTISDSTYLSPASKELLPYTGDFMDSNSQRATMTSFATDKNALLIDIQWSNSAWEYTQWTMTATFNGDNKLIYTDEKRTDHKTDEDGNDTETVIYENKEGYFTLADGKILWDGASSKDCKDCIFEAVIISDDEF